MNQGRDTPQRRPTEWDHPRAYLVPRAVALEVPEGWELVGPVRQGTVGPYSSPFIVSCASWPDEVAQHMDGVALIGSVRMSIWQARTPGYTRHLPGPWGAVKVRLLVARALPAGAGLEVSAATSRQGEVLCWPLRRLPLDANDGGQLRRDPT